MKIGDVVNKFVSNTEQTEQALKQVASDTRGPLGCGGISVEKWNPMEPFGGAQNGVFGAVKALSQKVFADSDRLAQVMRGGAEGLAAQAGIDPNVVEFGFYAARLLAVGGTPDEFVRIAQPLCRDARFPPFLDKAFEAAEKLAFPGQ